MDTLTETINTFDKYAEQYADKYMDYEPYAETWRRLSGLLDDNASILDVACGPGNIAKYLLGEKQNRIVYGIDLSVKMVSLARLNNARATFDVMDVRDIAELGKIFDAVVAGFCVPYLSKEEVIRFIGDARNCMRPGGIIYLSTMEGDYASSGFQTRNNDRVRLYYYQGEWLFSTLEKAGFEVIDVERKSFDREGEPNAVDIFIYARAR